MSKSEVMSRIRSSRNRTIDFAMAHALHWAGCGKFEYRPKLPFRPDMAYTESRLVVFMDGCLRHGCPEHYKPPKTNAKYWIGKVRANRKRDDMAVRHYVDAGWRIFRIWEHDVADSQERKSVALRIARAVKEDEMDSWREIKWN